MRANRALCKQICIGTLCLYFGFGRFGSNSFKCRISLYIQNNWNPQIIDGEGNSEMSAKMNAAKKALDFLHKYQIEQIAQKATPDTAVQTLNTLYLKKFISKPELNCSVSPDEDGNQIWRCECFIKEYEDWKDIIKRESEKNLQFRFCFFFSEHLLIGRSKP